LIEALRAGFARFGIRAEVARKLPDVDEKVVEPAFTAIRSNPQLNWAFVQRGLMVHGLDTLMDYLRVCVDYRLSNRVADCTMRSPAPRHSSVSTGPRAPATIARFRHARSISSAPTTGSTACSDVERKNACGYKLADDGHDTRGLAAHFISR